MLQLSLSTPRRVQVGKDTQPPGTFLDWLPNAPISTFTNTSEQLAEALEQDNNQTINAEKRFSLLESAHPYAVDVCDLLKNRRKQAGPVFSQKHSDIADSQNRLLHAMANGYKSVIMDAQRLTASGMIFKKMPEALFRATQYLAAIVLNSYANYRPCPDFAWKEIHQIFVTATATEISDKKIQNTTTETKSSKSTIANFYREILILAISNPYQLMPSEAETLYKMAGQWLNDCKLVSIESQTTIKSAHVIENGTTQPPRFITKTGEQIANGYQIDLTNMASIVKDEIRSIEIEHRRQATNRPLPFNQRIRRDLLVRLSHAWAGRRERKHPRKDATGVVFVSIGYNSCHFYINNEKPFEPELEELKIHRIDFGKKGSGLSLIAKEQRVWSMNESESSIKSGLSESRQSNFDQDSVSKDAWQQIYATKTTNRIVTQNFHVDPGSVINSSAGGIALSLDKSVATDAKVGDLVVFHSNKDSETPTWNIGSISWTYIDKTIDIGIKGISSQASAVGCRAVEGTGMGSEYLRCFMTQTRSSAPKLITPAAIYDIHTLLAINLGTRLIYARILKLIDVTQSYSMFQIKPETIPENEILKINKLRGLQN